MTPLTMRGRPRWSVGPGEAALSAASMAGLPGRRAWVGVGPPLSWSGPSLGSMGVAVVPTWLPFWPLTRPVLPSPLPIRSWLDLTTAPEMSGPLSLAVLPATRVFMRVTVPPAAMPPPRPAGPARVLADAWLPLRVQLIRVSVPLLQIPPPPAPVLLADTSLPLRVELMTVAVPLL